MFPVSAGLYHMYVTTISRITAGNVNVIDLDTLQNQGVSRHIGKHRMVRYQDTVV